MHMNLSFVSLSMSDILGIDVSIVIFPSWASILLRSKRIVKLSYRRLDYLVGCLV